MFIAHMCDVAGNCRLFGPFKTDLAARDWGMEAQEAGFLPRTMLSVRPAIDVISGEIEEPIELGFDPGL